ncbi:MAG: hypothetical protein A2075_08320 [Geobacteraceae bacterium GWC2_58_44]|nr:MAG: hypothetical protein A2075_08320 [Geobacteraceae bacterium GWC2_58_44]HBG07377.1 hypothetical protein [Geobacter sp.]
MLILPFLAGDVGYHYAAREQTTGRLAYQVAIIKKPLGIFGNGLEFSVVLFEVKGLDTLETTDIKGFADADVHDYLASSEKRLL